MLLAKQIKRLPIIHPKGSKRVSEINTRAKNYIEYVNIILFNVKIQKQEKNKALCHKEQINIDQFFKSQ
jgi:hypothetical protein